MRLSRFYEKSIEETVLVFLHEVKVLLKLKID